MKKKLTEITYEKKDGEVKEYSIFEINTGFEFNTGIGFIAGFNVSAMSEEEKESLIVIQEEFELDTKPFMKHYRKFLNNQIIEVR